MARRRTNQNSGMGSLSYSLRDGRHAIITHALMQRVRRQRVLYACVNEIPCSLHANCSCNTLQRATHFKIAWRCAWEVWIRRKEAPAHPQIYPRPFDFLSLSLLVLLM